MKVRSNRTTGLWFAAAAVACICLSGLKMMSTYREVGEWLFLAGMPGAFVMMLFTGVHGDFNIVGGLVYVVVNSICFYYVFRFVAYLCSRHTRV